MFRIGEPDQALRDKTSAINLEPKIAHYYSERAFIFKFLGELNMAKSDKDEACTLDAKYCDPSQIVPE